MLWGVGMCVAGAALSLPACQTMNTDGMTPLPVGPLSFARDILPIFADRCVSCHRSGGIADLSGIDLNLQADRAFSSLVNQPSAQRPDLTLVVPGDADASLLYLKVSSANPPVGARMPLIAAPLSAAQVELIRRWIDEGAVDN